MLFFFFFLIIYLCFLISAAIAQIFNPIPEPVIPIGILIKEEKAEMETHPAIAESKKESVQYNSESNKPFCAFNS